MTIDEFRRELLKLHETMDVKEIASICRVSLPTVERWLAGATCPVKQLRNLLIEDIKKEQDKK
jgi:hypothetical protein